MFCWLVGEIGLDRIGSDRIRSRRIRVMVSIAGQIRSDQIESTLFHFHSILGQAGNYGVSVFTNPNHHNNQTLLCHIHPSIP